MKIHTEEYKEALIGVRETDEYLRYTKGGTWKRYNKDDIVLVKPILNATLFKTVMKELDIESKTKLEVGTVVDYKNGLKVGNDYEYIFYGRYTVYEVEYRPDTKTYYHICYDRMLNAMKPYETPDITFPISVNNYILAIAGKAGLLAHYPSIYDGNYVNHSKMILKDYFTEGNYTYRDVLDYLCEVIGGWLYINLDNDLALKYPTETREVFNEDYLNYINVSFEKKYGPINSVVFARANELDNIEYKDDESIEENGLCRVKFSDNPLLSDTNREQFMSELKDKIMGLEFYLNDLESKGITYLELGDLYTFKISEETINALKSGLVKAGMRKAQGNSNYYKCLMLNDETSFMGGIKELIFTDEPEETNTEYITTAPSDNSLKNAEILVNKTAGELVLKADSNGKVVQARLDADADDGSLFEVKADNIKLEGYTTINDGFSVDLNGNVTLTGGEIKSSNYVAETSGTKINLSNGSIDTKNFKVDSNGNTTMNNAIINGTLSRTWAGQSFNQTIEVGDPGSNGIALNIYNDSAYNDKVSINPGNIAIYTSNVLRELIGYGGVIQLYNGSGTEVIKLDSSNGNIRCVSLTQTSLEESKKNFTKLKSGLDIIKDIDIYKYNYKDENNKDKQHIGLVIGDKYKYSKEVTSPNNDGVDLYSLVSVCCKAIQEQQEQINSLKEEIKKIKESDK